MYIHMLFLYFVIITKCLFNIIAFIALIKVYTPSIINSHAKSLVQQFPIWRQQYVLPLTCLFKEWCEFFVLLFRIMQVLNRSESSCCNQVIFKRINSSYLTRFIIWIMLFTWTKVYSWYFSDLKKGFSDEWHYIAKRGFLTRVSLRTRTRILARVVLHIWTEFSHQSLVTCLNAVHSPERDYLYKRSFSLDWRYLSPYVI